MSRSLSDAQAVALAGLTLCSARAGVMAVPRLGVGAGLIVAGGVIAVAAAWFWARPLLLLAGVILLAWGLAVRAEEGRHSSALGAYTGWAILTGDPRTTLDGLQVDVSVRGKRVRASANGAPAWALERRETGDQVWVRGRIRASQSRDSAWERSRHLAGRMTVDAVGEARAGAWPWRWSNTVRRVLLRGVASLPRREQALYAGFLLGDDRRQLPEVAADFRASGLSHLLVVSGQNVAFVLAAASPLLSRLGLRARFVGAVLLVLAFGFVTRWEPSVIRAVGMVTVVQYARMAGRPVASLRVLATAVTALLLIDPLLSYSAGFGLSVSACLGLSLLGGPIETRLRGPVWVRAPLAATIAAQVGTAPLLVALGASLPVISVPANLAAVSVAEPITVWGLLAGVPAGLLGDPWAKWLHIPTAALITCVANVARVGAAFPWGPADPLLVGIFIVASAGAWLRRGRGWRWAAGLTLAAALASGAGHRGLESHQLVRGAHVWRAAGWGRQSASVLTIQRADPARLLGALQREGIRSVSVVIVVGGGRSAARWLPPVLARLGAPVVLVPAGTSVEVGARQRIEVRSDTVLQVGPWTIRASPRSPGRLDVEVGGPP